MPTVGSCFRTPNVFVASILAVASCGSGQDNDPVTLETVCGNREPVELVAERLLPLTPSLPFEVGDGDDVFAAVTFDPQYNPGGISSSPWDLYVIEASAEPNIDESNPLGVPSDTRLGIGNVDDYRQVSEQAGTYRVYSGGSPEIHVVRCDEL